MPVDMGSVTQRIAAAARAASARFPPLERPQTGAGRERLAGRDHRLGGDRRRRGKGRAGSHAAGSIARRGRPTVLLLHAFPSTRACGTGSVRP